MRKSGLRANKQVDFDLDFDLDFYNLINPYEEFKQDYKSIIMDYKKRTRGVCFYVYFKDEPDLMYLAFQEDKAKARSEALSYFIKFHPNFRYRKDRHRQYWNSGGIKVPALDKYADTKRVPIYEIIRYCRPLGCSLCGKGSFTYQDYLDKRCYVVEGEGNPNPYTQGKLLCHECYVNYFGLDYSK